MSLVLAYQNRGSSHDIVITNVAGVTITPEANDLVRCIIGREGETPKFTVTSGTPTAAGSSFTPGATNRLRLDADDLDFEPGTYTMFIDFYDFDDALEWKNVDRQVFVLEDT